jgi:hypothetical protein
LRDRPSRQRAGGGNLTLAEYLDHIVGSPRTTPGLSQRLSQRLREADDRIVRVENRSGQTLGRSWRDADNQTAGSSINNPYVAAKNPWLQHQFCSPLELGDLPFIVGRRPVAGETLPPWQPDLELNDAAPFRLSRNHFIIEEHDGKYRVRDLCSTLGTIVNGEPIGHHLRADASTAWGYLASDAPLRAGENEIIAGGADSPFVFSVFIASTSANDTAGKCFSDLGRVDKNADWQICIAENRTVEANKTEGNRQSYWNNAGRNRGGYYSGLGLGSGIGIGTMIAALRAAPAAVKRLLIVLALSVLAGGCSLPERQDVRAYDTCLSRHPHDTVVCEGPRQAYELEPSVVEPRSVASRPAAGYGY